MKQTKLIIFFLLLVSVLWFIYSKYGYLLQSYRNLPQTDKGDSFLQPPSDSPAISDQELSYLSLPDGFAISIFAANVPGARSMTMDEEGTIYVGTRADGAVYALADRDQDGRADERHIIARALNQPNGVAVINNTLYVAEIHRIIKFDNISATYNKNPTFAELPISLPQEKHHGWRYMAAGPDSYLYLGIGAPCNVCEDTGRFSRIIRVNPESPHETEPIALGVRNSVGFDWNQKDNSFWFTDNGRDNLGDDTPADELNRLRQVGDHFGFPYCHGRLVVDPQFGNSSSCSAYQAPIVELGPHVAALGMLFYEGEMFPKEYQDRIIIAEHGSWNRTVPIGYRLTTVNVRGESADNYQDFVAGWLDDKGEARGRPVDLLELPDGSVLISDDLGDAIYRLTYSGK